MPSGSSRRLWRGHTSELAGTQALTGRWGGQIPGSCLLDGKPGFGRPSTTKLIAVYVLHRHFVHIVHPLIHSLVECAVKGISKFHGSDGGGTGRKSTSGGTLAGKGRALLKTSIEGKSFSFMELLRFDCGFSHGETSATETRIVLGDLAKRNAPVKIRR